MLLVHACCYMNNYPIVCGKLSFGFGELGYKIKLCKKVS